MTRTMRWGREAVLWTGGALGALCVASFVAGWLFSITPLVFVSGSMSPAYEAGALGVAHEVPATGVEVGDVVSVVNAAGERVTHRVVAATPSGDRVALTLQGDTNNAPDAETYYVSSADRVLFGIPYAGRALSAASTPAGLLLGALLVLAAVVLGFGRRADDEPRPGGRLRLLLPAGVVSAITVGGVVGASGAAPWAFTSAVWTDSATATATITTPVTDTTAPVLSNPLPANAASGVGWSSLACAASANQVCVNATDTGGSGVSTVAVKLVRTSGTPQCWNGTTFVNGTACTPQPMVLVSGNQYRSTGLTAALMVNGTYQATYSASDVAGNVATPLVTTFTITLPAAPTITGCIPANGLTEYTLSWTWPGPGTATSFKLYYGGGGSFRSPTTLTDTTAPYTGISVPINDEAGTFRIAAVVGGVESALSNTYNYAGKNNSKTCGP